VSGDIGFPCQWRRPDKLKETTEEGYRIGQRRSITMKNLELCVSNSRDSARASFYFLIAKTAGSQSHRKVHSNGSLKLENEPASFQKIKKKKKSLGNLSNEKSGLICRHNGKRIMNKNNGGGITHL